MATILLVDDEMTMVQMVAEVLRADGHEVLPFTNYSGVIEALASRRPELVITDLYLDKTRPHGLDILRKVRELSPPPAVIVISGFGTVENAVDAMKLGAFDFLRKPFNLGDLRLCVRRALSYTAAVAENTELRKELRRQYRFSQIIGASPRMQEVFRLVEKVADTPTTVLVLGESGTGKELIARALHYNSNRAAAPFVPINCSALPENLLESELFGHRKGAFTGAVSDKDGLFQEAAGGTLFLDEIGTMPPQLQSRLLRVLQDKEVRRVGDNTAVAVDVRVIAATNENLETLVRDGRFREDLYYRLNVVPIALPPLRERPDDLPMLVAHFLKDRVHLRSDQPFRVTRRALAALTAYRWPGNVRELANYIERAAILADTPLIQVADLPPVVQACAPADDGQEAQQAAETATPVGAAVGPGPGAGTGPVVSQPATDSEPHPQTNGLVSLKKFLRDHETSYLRHAVAFANGDKEAAARLLDISLATLYRKLAESPETS
ncbi:MAG: sigma-54-dependent Fis family transcriptional regulator [Verrucomicrobiae bacterium]|nr:sigma-54-dependent Fis family transcriptional regulator [Verrucomicrobiae bacterium]